HIFGGEIKMKISYHGQSAVYVQTDSHHILIDPFITGNGLSDLDPETVEADVIILTHGHGDHLGDTEAIAKRTGAKVIAINELAIYLGEKGLDTHGMNVGGGYSFDFGHVKYTQAFHSSAFIEDNENIVYTGMSAAVILKIDVKTIYRLDYTALFSDLKYTQAFHSQAFIEDNGNIVYTGMPAGVILTIDGKTIYHLGDTALFGDLKMYGEQYDFDLAFVPIGDNFTMGPDDALLAS